MINFNRISILIVFIYSLISFDIEVLANGRKCRSYPYPDGFHVENSLDNNKILIYTYTVYFSTENSKKIEFIRTRSDSYSKFFLKKFIELKYNKNKNKNNNKKNNNKVDKIQMFKLHSCTSKNGIYKVTYAQLERKSNFFKMFKNFFLK